MPQPKNTIPAAANAMAGRPKGWKLERFDKYVTLEYGSGLPKSKRLIGDNPVFGSNGIVDYHKDYLVKGPGIIVGRKGTIGVIVWVDKNFWPIDTTYYVRHKESVRLRWLYYKLQELHLEKLNTASGTPGLNRDEVYRLKIGIPPESEQQKIADILSSADAEIEAVDKEIAATERLKRALMQDLLTRGIGHKKFKKTELGEIPVGWEVTKIGDICDVRDGTHDSPKYQSDGIPLITSKNLRDGNLDFSDAGLISEQDYKKIEKRSRVDDGDILFGMIGTIGNTVLIKKERDFAIKNVALIKFNKRNVYNYYLLFYLNSKYTRLQFDKILSGSTQKFIALGVIRSLKVVLPKFKEQKKIAEILSSVDNKLLISKQLKQKLLRLKKGLMSDLLSGRVRVK